MVIIIPAIVVSAVVSGAMRWASPLEGIAERVMSSTPLNVATFLLLNVHSEAATLAALGAIAVLLLSSGLVGLVTSLIASELVRVPASVAGLALVLFVAFPTYDSRSYVLLMAVFGLGMVAASRLSWLDPSIAPPQVSPSPARSGATAITGTDRQALLSRKAFVADTVTVLGGAAILTALPFAFDAVESEPRSAYFLFREPRLPPEFRLPGLSSWVTSASSFYVNSKDLYSPRVQAWSLRIGGLVREPISLSLADIVRLPRRDEYVTMECVDNPVGGPLIGCALWSGVGLRDLLTSAGVVSPADAVTFTAWDGYIDSLPLEAVLRNEVLLAYAMNGMSLSVDHGYPLRLIVPGLYGFKSVKWLRSIEVVRSGVESIWQSRGWSAGAENNTTTRIDVARDAGGTMSVAGIAFAGSRGIAKVQTRAVGGQWHDANLSPMLSRTSWRLWAADVAQTGQGMVEARAFDGSGVVQTSTARGSFPDGATGYAMKWIGA